MNHDLMVHRFFMMMSASLILRVKNEVLLQKKHTDPIDVLDSVNQVAFACCFVLIR